MSCAGCEALKEQVDYLRGQAKDLQEQLLAATNPVAYQLHTGKATKNPMMGVGTEVEGTDPQGDNYMIVGGERVSTEEFQKTLDRLENQMSGRSGAEKDDDIGRLL